MADTSPPARPTSADVARHAGVSRATVSYVLNGVNHAISEPVRQRVLAAARELHYAPNASARSLRTGHSNLVLLPLPQDRSLPGQNVFLEHLNRELGRRDLALLLHGDSTASGIKGARTWAELRPAAVYLDAARGTRRAVTLLRRAGVRAVLLGGVPAVPYAPTLPLDQAGLARVATRHLFDRGHRRLACLVPQGNWAALAEPRCDAVADIAATEGGSVEPVPCEFSLDSLRPAIARWRDPACRPDAVYAFNDEFALLLVQALSEAGLEVPGDIAVIGSGDQPLGAALRPALTTVHFDLPRLAHAVADSLRRLLDGQDLDPAVTSAVQPRLIIRESA
ncbi:LacI family transcriptional regulator [Streptomyces sp. alain-838]|nr:LacI family DNA-binding transcriptional regulator [Streptomyces sp. alain-838]PAK28022.1 LacI family transcriptional regulator [Streptomyces sp. alain-838]